LQWLDPATLDLLEDLLTQETVGHLLLIGAYRNNEVDSDHPLMRKLVSIRQSNALVQEIVLSPLAPEHVEQLVAEALQCDMDRAIELARLIYDKTAGNPFFTIQCTLRGGATDIRPSQRPLVVGHQSHSGQSLHR
jgi:predicted ATPase